MTESFQLVFPDSRVATAARVASPAELPAALGALGLARPRPSLVVVGGAGGLGESDLDRMRPLFAAAIVPVLWEHGGVGVDGGTRSGVMRLFGEARAAAGAGFPLVGVVAEGTARLPGEPGPDERAALEPGHTHFVVVPGDQWGDESPWIADVATALSGAAPSVTVLVNGGQIALDDVEHSLDAGREVVVVAGSGRAADALAAALDGAAADRRAAELAGRGGIHSVPADDPAGLARSLSAALRAPATRPRADTDDPTPGGPR